MITYVLPTCMLVISELNILKIQKQNYSSMLQKKSSFLFMVQVHISSYIIKNNKVQ
jgi:hypothetical protein